jgi:MerR family transcriptional regulator, heat shock protein HspR
MKKIGNPGERSMGALQPVEHSAHATYTIEAIANLAQIPRRLIVLYYKHGLVAPASESPDAGWYFDDQAIHVVRRIQYLRTECGVNLEGIKLIMSLTKEVERLREEVRFFQQQ